MLVCRCSSQLSGHQNLTEIKKVTTSERSRGICCAPFFQTKAPASELAALAPRLFLLYLGYFSMQRLVQIGWVPTIKPSDKMCERTCRGLCLGERRTADPSASTG